MAEPNESLDDVHVCGSMVIPKPQRYQCTRGHVTEVQFRLQLLVGGPMQSYCMRCLADLLAVTHEVEE